MVLIPTQQVDYAFITVGLWDTLVADPKVNVSKQFVSCI